MHCLKTLPRFFQAVADGSKTFEIRLNDRGYRLLDVLRLQEWTWEDGYTGRELHVRVTYITDWEQKPNYVVMSIKIIRRSPL